VKLLVLFGVIILVWLFFSLLTYSLLETGKNISRYRYIKRSNLGAAFKII